MTAQSATASWRRSGSAGARRRPAAPSVATTRVMAWTNGVLYCAGAVALVAVTAPLARTGAPEVQVMWGVAVLAGLTGVLALRYGRHLPRWAFHVLVASGTGLISLATAVCPSPTSAIVVAAVGTFVAVDAFWFFAFVEGVLQLALLAVAEVVVLTGHPGVGVGDAVGMVVICLALAAVVGNLVQLAAGASRDSLTGLANRRGFDVALEAALAASERSGAPLSVALIDVDHFKSVNDTRGHAAGDQLLQAIATDCTRALPASAVLARLGGDEFAVLLPGAAGLEAQGLVEAMRTANGRTGLSCGVAQHLAGCSGADLLRRADTALYAAKAAGRGRTVLSSSDADAMAHDLADAIATDGLHVHLQPVVALPGETLVGVEALVRWTHPVRGAVPPAQFVPVAEAAGLIVDLGAAVLAQACRAARQLQTGTGRTLLLTVNASGRELTEPGYCDALLRILATTGWPPGQLVVEVTESLFEASDPQALRNLTALRHHGVDVAIDDFGTGYSAFSRLDTLPADYLKLDHSFISTITTSERRAGVLRALLSLASSLGLRVVAEGVETPEQGAVLAELGCTLAQGYLYGRPRPVEELLADATGGPSGYLAAQPSTAQ